MARASRLYKKLVVEKNKMVRRESAPVYDMTSFGPGPVRRVGRQMRPGVKAADTQAGKGRKANLPSWRDKAGGRRLSCRRRRTRAGAIRVSGPRDSEFRRERPRFGLGVLRKCSAELPHSRADKYLDGIDKGDCGGDVQRVRENLPWSRPNMTEGVLIPTGVLPHGGGGLSGGELR